MCSRACAIWPRCCARRASWTRRSSFIAKRWGYGRSIWRAAAAGLGSLALVLQDQGKLNEEERLYREALEIQRALLGVWHPAVATSLNNLALVLQDQGKLAEAEELHREALAMRRALLGARHPAVATSLNNLAAALYEQGKLAEAELS